MPFHGDAGADETVTAWPRVGVGADGRPTVSTVPVEIEVRWDETYREVRLPDGSVVAVDADVAGFGVDLPPGSAVWRGRVDDLPGTGYAPRSNVFRVATFSKDQDWRGTDTFRSATLYRASDAIPVGSQAAEP